MNERGGGENPKGRRLFSIITTGLVIKLFDKSTLKLPHVHERRTQITGRMGGGEPTKKF